MLTQTTPSSSALLKEPPVIVYVLTHSQGNSSGPSHSERNTDKGNVELKVSMEDIMVANPNMYFTDIRKVFNE